MLPPEIISQICEHVDSDTLIEMSWVCKMWRSVVLETHFAKALAGTNPLFKRNLTFRKTNKDCALIHKARMKHDIQPPDAPAPLEWQFCKYKVNKKLPWDFYCLGKLRVQQICSIYPMACVDTHNYGLHDWRGCRVASLTTNLYGPQWWADTYLHNDFYQSQYGLEIYFNKISERLHMIASTPEMLVVLLDGKPPTLLIKYAESPEQTFVIDDYNCEFDSDSYVFASGSVAIFRAVSHDMEERFFLLTGSEATPLHRRRKPVYRRVFYFIYEGTIWEVFDKFDESMMVIQDLFFNLPSMSFRYNTSHDKKKWRDSNLTMDYNWWAVHEPHDNYRYVVIYGVYNARYVIDMQERKVITWDCTVIMSDRLLVGLSEGEICAYVYDYNVLYPLWMAEELYEDEVLRLELV